MMITLIIMRVSDDGTALAKGGRYGLASKGPIA